MTFDGVAQKSWIGDEKAPGENDIVCIRGRDDSVVMLKTPATCWLCKNRMEPFTYAVETSIGSQKFHRHREGECP